jgi:photosystem II stability/assembly factor-like uncharacterized protein
MRSPKKYRRVIILALLVVSLLFMSLAFGLILSPNTAIAASPTGWFLQATIPGVDSLENIDALDANTAWAVGNQGTIVKTSDGGENWIVQASNPNQFLMDVCAVNADVAWSVGMGGSDAVVLSTSDGGNHWVSHDSVKTQFRGLPLAQFFNSGVRAPSVAALDATTAWVTANYNIHIPPNPFNPYGANINTSAVWKTVDGGDTWNLQINPILTETLSQIFVFGQTVWTAGGSYEPILPTPISVALRSTDGGATWATQDIGAEHDIRVFAALDANNAWALSLVPKIYKTTDGGASWTQIGPQFYFPPTNIVPVNANVIWMASATNTTNGHQGIIIKTTDGGSTWTIQPIPTFGLSGMDAVDANTAWAVGYGGVIFKTTGGGGIPPVPITSVTPSWGDAGMEVEVTIAGAGFPADAAVSLKSGNTVISPTSTTVVSATEIAAKFNLAGAVVGAYDLVISNPSGYSALLAGGFSVTAPSPCGFGSGLGFIMLGISLGLLSLAGSFNRKKRKA